MEEVVRGAGDMNLTRSGEASFDMLTGAADSERHGERFLGVSGPATSVVGINTSCDGWCRGAWLSILPEAQTIQAMGDTLGCGARQVQNQSFVATMSTMRATGAVRRIQDVEWWARTRDSDGSGQGQCLGSRGARRCAS